MFIDFKEKGKEGGRKKVRERETLIFEVNMAELRVPNISP